MGLKVAHMNENYNGQVERDCGVAEPGQVATSAGLELATRGPIVRRPWANPWGFIELDGGQGGN